MVGVSFELSDEGNRVAARLWLWVLQYEDVRTLTTELLHEWRYRLISRGSRKRFPCVDLSAVKFNRKNWRELQAVCSGSSLGS